MDKSKVGWQQNVFHTVGNHSLYLFSEPSFLTTVYFSYQLKLDTSFPVFSLCVANEGNNLNQPVLQIYFTDFIRNSGISVARQPSPNTGLPGLHVRAICRFVGGFSVPAVVSSLGDGG